MWRPLVRAATRIGAVLVAGLAWGGTMALALEPPDAHCRSDKGWDIACLRHAYRGPPDSWPRPHIDQGVAWQEFAPVPPVASPAVTASADGTAANADQIRLAQDLSNPTIVALGQRLFFEPQLSRGKQLSCASCHLPERSFTDGKPLAIGADGLMGRRRTMPLYAAPFAPLLFWDGRAATLAQQVLAPIRNPNEMNHTVDEAVSQLSALPPYPDLFAKAFDPTDMAITPDVLDVLAVTINAERLSRALATYVATLRPPATRFDTFLAGERDALSDHEMLGLHLFRTHARCLNCHNGPLLTDQKFHDIGLSFIGRRNQDLGRYEITRDPADLGTFRTPSLRGVSRAGPWMHNGMFPTLEGLLRTYNAGMGATPQAPSGSRLTPRKSPLIRPLGLNADEIDALLAFLGVL